MNAYRLMIRSGKIVLLTLVLLSFLFQEVNPTAAAGGPQIFFPILFNGAPLKNDFVFYALSDSDIRPGEQDAFKVLQENASLQCISEQTHNSLTLDQARQNAWNFLVNFVGQANLDAFRAAPEVSSTDKLQLFAVTAIAAGEPDGALAAFLIANEKDPTSPTVLINAAGMLSSFGMFAEALAFLDAAQAIGDPLDAPLGISGKYFALNNRGRALMGLGLYGDAEPLLRQVTSNAPDLSEGRLNLAMALICQSKNRNLITDPQMAEAVRLYRKGDRANGGGPYVPETGWPVDLAGGKTFILPDLVIPTEAAYVKAFGQKALQLSEEANARYAKIADQMSAIDTQRTSGPPVSVITKMRFSKIMFDSNYTWTLPEFKAMWPLANWDPMLESNLATAFYNFTRTDYTIPECQSFVQQQWTQLKLPLIEFSDRSKKHAQAMYYRQTALAANLIDPLNHEEASLVAESHAEANLGYFMRDYEDLTKLIANEWDTCQGSLNSVDGFQPPSYNRSDPCPPNLRGVKLGLKLDDMAKISVSCEKVELEGSTPGLLGLFVKWTYDKRADNVTIFVGAKQGFDVGVAGISTKEGIYVTGTRGGITDVGAKVSTSGSLSSGVISGTVEGPGTSISVADVVSFWTPF